MHGKVFSTKKSQRPLKGFFGYLKYPLFTAKNIDLNIFFMPPKWTILIFIMEITKIEFILFLASNKIKEYIPPCRRLYKHF